MRWLVDGGWSDCGSAASADFCDITVHELFTLSADIATRILALDTTPSRHSHASTRISPTLVWLAERRGNTRTLDGRRTRARWIGNVSLKPSPRMKSINGTGTLPTEARWTQSLRRRHTLEMVTSLVSGKHIRSGAGQEYQSSTPAGRCRVRRS